MMDFALKMVNFVLKRFDAEEKFDWYCGWDSIEGTVTEAIKAVNLGEGVVKMMNEFCIQKDEFFIQSDELCIQNDEFCKAKKSVLVAGNGNSPCVCV